MTIDSFSGTYRFLSNFYPCYAEFELDVYPSAEHAYQASKSRDPRVRKVFQNPHATAAQAKNWGGHIKLNADDWNIRRIFNMRDILRSKFCANPGLGEGLLSTGDALLIEGNTWGDTFWGQVRGRGENWLGRLLMLQREDLRRRRESLF